MRKLRNVLRLRGVKRLKNMLVAGVMALGMLAVPVISAVPVWAEPTGTTTETNILPAGTTIEGMLKILLNVLVYGLGGAAVLGVVISGVLYMTARDNEQQVAAAKKRLFEVVIGLVAWALMYTVLQWLVPGSLGF